MQETRNKAHLKRNIEVFALPRGPAPNSSTPKAIMCRTTQPPHPSFHNSQVPKFSILCDQNQHLYQCQEQNEIRSGAGCSLGQRDSGLR